VTHEPETPRPQDDDARRLARGNLFAAEVVFLVVIGVVVVLAFLEALTYSLVSARTPYVIMVPLLILIAIQARRLWRVRAEFGIRERFSDALAGNTPQLNAVVKISAWLIVLVAMIAVFGHLAGVFVFSLILMRMLAGESWVLALAVAGMTTLFIFGVFEYVFNIELYRGLIVRYFLGFRDF